MRPHHRRYRQPLQKCAALSVKKPFILPDCWKRKKSGYGPPSWLFARDSEKALESLVVCASWLNNYLSLTDEDTMLSKLILSLVVTSLPVGCHLSAASPSGEVAKNIARVEINQSNGNKVGIP